MDELYFLAVLYMHTFLERASCKKSLYSVSALSSRMYMTHGNGRPTIVHFYLQHTGNKIPDSSEKDDDWLHNI